MTELEERAKNLSQKEYRELVLKVEAGKATDEEYVLKRMYSGMSEKEARELIPIYHETRGELAKARRGLYKKLCKDGASLLIVKLPCKFPNMFRQPLEGIFPCNNILSIPSPTAVRLPWENISIFNKKILKVFD